MERVDDVPAAEPDLGEPDSEQEQLEQTAPVMPWVLTLNQSVTYFQKLPRGRMKMLLVPAVRAPGGQAVPLPPGIEVTFGADGWEAFKRQVANDGELPPEIPIATAMPGGMRLRPPGA